MFIIKIYYNCMEIAMINKIKKFLIKFLGKKKVKNSLQDIKIEKCLL